MRHVVQSAARAFGAVQIGCFIEFAGNILQAGQINHDRIANAPYAHQCQRRNHPCRLIDPCRSLQMEQRENRIERPIDQTQLLIEQPFPQDRRGDRRNQRGKENDGAENRLTDDPPVQQDRHAERDDQTRRQ